MFSACVWEEDTTGLTQLSVGESKLERLGTLGTPGGDFPMTGTEKENKLLFLVINIILCVFGSLFAGHYY